jgi:hypothetical protein
LLLHWKRVVEEKWRISRTSRNPNQKKKNILRQVPILLLQRLARPQTRKSFSSYYAKNTNPNSCNLVSGQQPGEFGVGRVDGKRESGSLQRYMEWEGLQHEYLGKVCNDRESRPSDEDCSTTKETKSRSLG